MTDAAAHPLDRLSHWLMLVINGLKERVAAQGPKSRPLVPLVVSAWFRLNRIVQEFAQLTAMMREGRLPATRARRATRATKARAERGRRKRGQPDLAGTAPVPAPAPAPEAARGAVPVGLPRARLPTTHAWLIRLAPQTAQLRGQVETWLRDPEVWAVLEGSARARRIVRPLCRMLGIRPALQLGAAHPLALRRSPARTESPTTDGGAGEPAGAEPAGEGARPRRRPRKSRAASAPRPPGLRELEWPREPDWADGFT